MCIAYLALNSHRDWPLLIAANRDEFHQRPTLAAAPWDNHPDIIAGIDLEAGGTWLGISRHGRFGLLTNYREMGTAIAGAPSRGDLVTTYLTTSLNLTDYVDQVSQKAGIYNGFNLIVGDLCTGERTRPIEGQVEPGNTGADPKVLPNSGKDAPGIRPELFTTASYISNRTPTPGSQKLISGRYVVSNHLIDTPWPKAERLRQAFEQLDMDAVARSLRIVFSTLKDTTPADDAYLPSTGVSLEFERLLSSPFIISQNYGTRCSTVVAVHKSGRALLSEISYDQAGVETQRHDWPFIIAMPA